LFFFRAFIISCFRDEFVFLEWSLILLRESAFSIGFAQQEMIDFKTPFRYKKASTKKEEAC
jgi:hypothetical protein